MAHNDGYWIFPTGEIVLVGTSHVHELIAQPDRFGLTRAEVEDAYTPSTESAWDGRGRPERN